MKFCFLGIDGAGKTFHAKNISKRIEDKGISCEYVHYSFSIAVYFARLGRFGRKRLYPAASGRNAPGIGFPGWLIAALLASIALLQAWIIYAIRYGPRERNSILFFDRYFYDNFVHYVDSCPIRLMKIYLQLVPAPDIVFLLDLSSKIAFSRKQELGLRDAARFRSAYLQLAKQLTRTRVEIIDTEGDAQMVSNLIMRSLKKVHPSLV